MSLIGLLFFPLGGLSAQEVDEAVLTAQGVELYNAGHFEEAVTVFRALLGKVPKTARSRVEELLARALSARGVERFNAGETEAAESAFREALQYQRDFFAHFGLGFLHLARLEDAAAALHLKEAALLEPDHAKTHKLQALLAYRRGDVDGAITHMERVRDSHPEDREARDAVERWRLESRHVASFRRHQEGKVDLRVDPSLSGSDVARFRGLLRKVLEELKRKLAVAEHGSLVVIVFAEGRFQRATGSHEWVGGLYDGQLKVPFPERDEPEDRAELEATVRHEMAHFLIQTLAPDCPNWLNEGLAQLLEERYDPAAVSAQLRSGAQRRQPLATLPMRLWEVEDLETARWTYLQGLGFVQFLSSRYQRFRLVLLLDSLARERSLSRAFEMTYGLPLEALETLWWKAVLEPPEKAL